MEIFGFDYLVAMGIGFLLGIIVVSALLWLCDDWM